MRPYNENPPAEANCRPDVPPKAPPAPPGLHGNANYCRNLEAERDRLLIQVERLEAEVERCRPASVEMGGQRLKVINWNELSRRGLLVQINDQLRPLGLAVMREVETGVSHGAIVLGVSDGE